MKFERTAPVRIGHISQIDYFVTDAAPPSRLRRICEDNGVVLDVATEDGSDGKYTQP